MFYKENEVINLKDTESPEVKEIIEGIKEIKETYKFPIKVEYGYVRDSEGIIYGGRCISIPLSEVYIDKNGFRSVFTYQDSLPTYNNQTQQYQFIQSKVITGDIHIAENEIEWAYYLLKISNVFKNGFVKVRDSAIEAKATNKKIGGKAALEFYTSALSPFNTEQITKIAIANGVEVKDKTEDEIKVDLRRTIEDRANRKGNYIYERFINDTKFGEDVELRVNIQKAKESGKVIYVSPKDGYGAKWDVYNSEDEFVESVPIMPQDVKDKRYEVLLNAVMRSEKLKNAINGVSGEEEDFANIPFSALEGKNYQFVYNVARAKGIDMIGDNGKKASLKLLLERLAKLEGIPFE